IEQRLVKAGHGMVRTLGDLPAVDEYERRLAAMLSRGFFGMMVAELSHDAILVGYVQWQRFEPSLLRHAASLSMGVDPAFQGKGVGTTLLNHALETLRVAGLHRVELSVLADNDRAKRLYERAGFEVEGVRKDFVRRGERYVDDVLMARRFTER
ncbi:MAG: GNAT family N-acetyltransferase, partial [Myxococcota bacterium]